MKNKIYQYMIDKNISIDKDIYEYGFSILKRYSLFLSFVFFLSLSFNVEIETIFFIFSYIPLRKHLGGFHFSKSTICLLFSVIITLIVSIISTEIQFNNITVLILCLIMFILTFLVVPIDHPNKRLSLKEKTFYKRKSLKLEIFYFLTIIFLQYFKLNNLINTIIFSFIISIISLCSAKLLQLIK